MSLWRYLLLTCEFSRPTFSSSFYEGRRFARIGWRGRPRFSAAPFFRRNRFNRTPPRKPRTWIGVARAAHNLETRVNKTAIQCCVRITARARYSNDTRYASESRRGMRIGRLRCCYSPVVLVWSPFLSPRPVVCGETRSSGGDRKIERSAS